jgi:hypothetical protein
VGQNVAFDPAVEFGRHWNRFDVMPRFAAGIGLVKTGTDPKGLENPLIIDEGNDIETGIVGCEVVVIALKLILEQAKRQANPEVIFAPWIRAHPDSARDRLRSVVDHHTDDLPGIT